MATFLESRDAMRETLKAFLLEQAERLKRHAQDLCTQTGRPYEYLSHAARKEDLVRKIAERDEIAEGLVCVLSVVVPRFRSRSTSTATSGWLGNSIVTTSST